MRGRKVDFKLAITRRMAESASVSVWTPSDFLDLGSRAAIDQALSRLVASNVVRRIARGLYDIAQVNVVTGVPTTPSYVAVVNAIARRDKVRMVLDAKNSDPMNTSDNRVVVLTKARLRPLKLGELTIEFRQPRQNTKRKGASPSKKAPVRLTGNSGSSYEDLVSARFLLDMLSATNSLGTEFGRVTRVDWQARDDGWLADDLAISCETPQGEKRAAGISIKSDQQVNTAGFPADFVNTAWSQWLGRGTNRTFRPGIDAIVLVTAELPSSLKRAWEPLLTEVLQTTPERMIARLTPDSGDGTQSSQLQRTLFHSFLPPEGWTEGKDPSNTVRLLHDVRLLDFDFNTPASHDANVAVLDCQNILSTGQASDAQKLWDRLIGIAAEKRPAGGSIDLRELLAKLRDEFNFQNHPDFRADWSNLERFTREAMDGVQTLVAGTVQLPRTDERAAIRNRLTSAGACFLVGESGCGKSALAKEVAGTDYPRVIWLTANVLDHDTEAEFDRAISLRHPLVQVLRAAPERCLVVFDGIDAYTERALRLTSRFIKDLLAADATHIHLLFSVQFAAAEKKMRQLALLGVAHAVLAVTPVERPTESDVRDLLARFPNVRWVAVRPELRSVLTNLKILDWFARTLANDAAAGEQTHVGLTGLIDQLWEHWTDGPGDGFARSHLLMSLATAEADALSRGVPRNQIGYAEQAALPALIQSDLVRVRDERVSFAHDLLGDWARLRVLVAEDPTLSTESRDRALSPRWQQAVRLFGQRLLEHSQEDQERWRQSVEQAGEGSSPDELMRDLFLDALFLATNAFELMNRAWSTLSANNGRLLNRLLHRFLFVATLPSPYLGVFSQDPEDATRFEHLFRIPFLPYWGPLLAVLHAHREDVVRLAPHNGARVCALWLHTTPVDLGQGRLMPWRQDAAELAIAISREIQARNVEYNHYGGSGGRVVYDALLHAARDCPAAAGELCLELAGRKDLSAEVAARRDLARQKRVDEQNRLKAEGFQKVRTPPIPILRGRRREPWPDGPHWRIERAFREACLDSGPFTALIKASPDVALEVLLAVSIEEPQHDEFGSRSSLPECGLSYWPKGEPPAYFRGPFLQFLRHAPSQGLSFVLKLTNFGTHRHMQDRGWSEMMIDGRAKRWYGDANVFRWHHDWPLFHGSQIQSALMALEQWFYEQIDQGANIEPWIGRILAESESLAFAGLLLDVGKRAPSLFSTVLSPLFFTWEIWNWDFQLAILRQTDQQMAGYWGQQAPQLVALAQKWHQLPHRSESLLGPDGSIARTMLGHQEFQSFFSDVRGAWSKQLKPDPEPEHLRLLIERINPANYTFQQTGSDVLPTSFQWPAAIAQENEEQLRRISEQQTLSLLPWRCRKLLDSEKSLPPHQAQGLWDFLQAADTGTPNIASDSDEPLLRIEDVFCGGIAVLLATSRKWLLEEPARMAWCRMKLQATIDNPPSPRRFDSELSVGNNRWDTFATESGVFLLAADPQDVLARKLVAAGLTAFNYHTTAVTMTRAAPLRQQLGSSFDQMVAFCVQWAALRPLQVRAADPSLETERAQFTGRKQSLMQSFVDGTLVPTLPDLKETNELARAGLDAIHEKQFPGSAARSHLIGRGSGRSRSRETLDPKRLGLDSHVMKAAFGWLDVRGASTSHERGAWLGFIRECLGVVLESIPLVEPSMAQEIDGLPSDFDDWVLQLVARTIPCLTAEEHPEELWRSILERGAPAHHWVERFFWHWFTNGLAVTQSVAEFVRIWRAMISYALQSPAWDPTLTVGHELDGIVVELLCFDPRWNSLVQNETNAAAVGALEDMFERAFQRWGAMPKITNGFSMFAIQAGAKKLLLPGIRWISTAANSFDTYDWKYGLEENVTEFMRLSWQRESPRISNDPTVREPFLSVLAILASRGGHAAIALRDRIAGSSDT